MGLMSWIDGIYVLDMMRNISDHDFYRLGNGFIIDRTGISRFFALLLNDLAVV